MTVGADQHPLSSSRVRVGTTAAMGDWMFPSVRVLVRLLHGNGDRVCNPSSGPATEFPISGTFPVRDVVAAAESIVCLGEGQP